MTQSVGHKQIDTTLGYARLYDGTLAADYYSAMNKVERQLALPESNVKEPPRIGELIALADALRNGSLNPTQTEIVRALREGLGLLGDMEDVKVLELPQLVERLELPELCYEERLDVASQLRQALSRVNEHAPPRDYGMLGEGIRKQTLAFAGLE